MSRTFKTWRNPYDEGFNTCRRKEITINPGVTVLVGCNGAGKSTLLHNIKEELKKENIPAFVYDNKSDGGHRSITESLHNGDTTFAATALCSSEGENISLNLYKIATKLKKFIETGDSRDKLTKAFESLLSISDEENETPLSNERWILLDAMDSGYSIDNVIEMKSFFQLVIEDASNQGKELYIVISSNEYELVHESDCFDVMEGKYIRFNTYDEYKKFILKTRTKKNERYKNKQED